MLEGGFDHARSNLLKEMMMNQDSSLCVVFAFDKPLALEVITSLHDGLEDMLSPKP